MVLQRRYVVVLAESKPFVFSMLLYKPPEQSFRNHVSRMVAGSKGLAKIDTSILLLQLIMDFSWRSQAHLFFGGKVPLGTLFSKASTLKFCRINLNLHPHHQHPQ